MNKRMGSHFQDSSKPSTHYRNKAHTQMDTPFLHLLSIFYDLQRAKKDTSDLGENRFVIFLDFQNTFEIWPEQFHKRPVVGCIEACHGLHLVPRMRFGDLLTRPLFRERAALAKTRPPACWLCLSRKGL